MIVTWHVLGMASPVVAVPWRPAGATYWQAGQSAGDRIAMTGPEHWSFLGVWPDEQAALAAEDSLTALGDAVEAWHLHLRPVSGHGDVTLVGGVNPFADLPRTAGVVGRVAVLTVAVVPPDPEVVRSFFGAAFGPVAASLAEQPGCLAVSNQRAAEIEELAAVTLSVWDDLRSATAWAYQAGPHRAMLERSRVERLFDGSGFWRFALLSSRGTVRGRDPLSTQHCPGPGGHTCSPTHNRACSPGEVH